MTLLNLRFRSFDLRFRSACAVAFVTMLAVPLGAQLQSPRYQSPGFEQQPQKPVVPELPETPAITPNGRVMEDVVARVNDQIISRSDLERAQAQLAQEMAQNHVPEADAQKRMDDLLRDLIDQQLLLSKGKDLGINPDAEVLRRLDDIRKQNHMNSMEDLEKAARAQGVSFEDFKASVRNNIITSSVVRDEVGRRLQMTQADERKYYDAHKDQFVQPEQIRLSEILIPVAADADPAAVEAAHKKAEEAIARLRSGAKFADVAKEMSGGPTASQGGDLGYFKHGALAAVLEQKTFALKAGEYTEPTRTRQGFVILQTTEHQQAGAPPLEQVEQQVQEAMYGEQMGPALRAYLTKLREEAYIDIKPGFVDTGASPNQTKPIFTAYAPPAPKKKPQESKQRFDRHDANTSQGKVQPATVELDKKGHPKKVKREKIRYGQAPRLALPAGPGDTSVANEAAPGTAIAPVDNSNTLSVADNPLAPAAPAQKKSRYSHREEEVKVEKQQAVQRKALDKAAAMPEAASKQEVSSKQVQSSPLGLNGDTAKKKKKKRAKGEAKERMQEKEPTKKAPLVQNPMPDKKTGLPPQDTRNKEQGGSTTSTQQQ